MALINPFWNALRNKLFRDDLRPDIWDPKNGSESKALFLKSRFVSGECCWPLPLRVGIEIAPRLYRLPGALQFPAF